MQNIEGSGRLEHLLYNPKTSRKLNPAQAFLYHINKLNVWMKLQMQQGGWQGAGTEGWSRVREMVG
jgi:hypothetical protein